MIIKKSRQDESINYTFAVLVPLFQLNIEKLEQKLTAK